MRGETWNQARRLETGTSGRIPATDVGSRPRTGDLVEIMFAREDGIPIDQAAPEQRVQREVYEAVRARSWPAWTSSATAGGRSRA
jgi:hypothetical protein